MGPKSTHRFQAKLVPGGKQPYDTWTFVVLPSQVAAALGAKRGVEVCRTLKGVPFRGTVSTGEGVRRMPVPRALLDQAGATRGDTVPVVIQLDVAPRDVEVPEELRAVLAADAEAARLYKALPPSLRRAWATHVAQAKHPETRARRAKKAPDAIRARLFPGQ
jgi:hypothetical protein